MKRFVSKGCRRTTACLFLVSTSVMADPTPLSGAKTSGGSTEPSAATLDGVTVIGTRTPRTLKETAGSVTVIDQSQIEQNQVQTIQDLVRYEPDLSVSSDPVRFGASGFTIRGIGGNRVLELVDGVPVSDSFSIGDFSDAVRNFVDPDLIKRVEILRGAASALYGSDAIGGVVSITTRDPQDYLQAGQGWNLLARSSYASVDNDASEMLLGAFGNTANAGLLQFSRRDGHEADNHGDVNATGPTRTDPNPQTTYNNDFLAKTVFNRVNSRYRLSISGSQGGTKTNVLSDVASQDLSAELGMPPGSYVLDTHSESGDDSQRALRLSGDAQWEKGSWYDVAQVRLYGQSSTTTQSTVQQQDQIMANPAPPPTSIDTPLLIERDFRFRQDVGGFGVNLNRNWDQGLIRQALTGGMEGTVTRTSELRDGEQTDQQTGDSTKNVPPDNFPTRDFPPSLTWQAGAYAQDEIGIGQVTLIPALRDDYYRLQPLSDATYADANPGVPPVGLVHNGLSPKLGLLYDLARDWTAYAQYAHGFRAPPYDDVNVGFTNLAFGYTAVPNPNLKPETSDSYETGLRFDQGHSQLSGAIYYSRYHDFIEPYVSLGVNPATDLLTFQAQNFTDVRIYGAELSGVYGFEFCNGLNVHAALNYTRGDNLQDHAPLNSVDPAKGVVGVEYAEPTQRWDGQLSLTVAQHQHQVDSSAGGTGSYDATGSGDLFQSPGYAKLDLLGWYALTPRLRLSAAVFNLTNQKYWDWSAVQGQYANNPAIDLYTSPGVNGRVSLRWSFL